MSVESLTDRFNLALQKTKIKITELNDITNIPTASLYNLKNNASYGSKYTRDIANALGISYTWLAFGEGEIYEKKSNIKNIPKISIENLSNSRSIDYKTDEYQSIDTDKNIDFIIQHNDNSLSNTIPSGALLGISTTFKEEDGFLYVVKHIPSKTVLVRKLEDNLFVSENKILFNPIKFDSNIEILGKVSYVSYFT